MRLALLLSLLAVLPAASAPPGAQAQAERLVAEGVELGKAGRLVDAIARFKSADALAPDAIYDCNIALSYVRLNRPARAMYFLERCRHRARAPLPDWVATRRADLLATLERGAFARVGVESTPNGAWVAFSAFEPDERAVTPVDLWLPLGAHVLTARSEGRADLTRPVTLTTSEPLHVHLQWPPVASAPPPRSARPDTPPVQEKTRPLTEPDPVDSAPVVVEAVTSDGPARWWQWTALGVGVVALAGGGVVHAAALETKDDADALHTDDPAFDTALDDFRTERGLALGLYGAGAALACAGVWALLAGEPPATALAPTSNGLVLRVRLP